jgi:ribosomal protein S18 acetylase RimI-like enzyme
LNDSVILTRTLEDSDLEGMKLVQEHYAECHPGTSIMSLDVYHSPGFGWGKNIFCAFDAGNRLVGYAPLFPALIDSGPENLPHRLWAEIKVDPTFQDGQASREALLACLLRRAREIVSEAPQRAAHIIFQYFPYEEESIDFLFKHGFVHTESVYALSRDLTLPVPTVLPPPGMTIQDCRMESEAEQRLYVQARNLAFPESPITLSDWQHFLKSPMWKVGACLSAFDQDELAGCITLFWDEALNQATGKLVGSTEFLFVLPRWRGIGLGSYLVAQGLIHLKKHGLLEAQLEVRAANAGALGLYTALGYQIKDESWFLVRTI